MITRRTGQQVACDGVRVAWIRPRFSSPTLESADISLTARERFSIDGIQVTARSRGETTKRIARAGGVRTAKEVLVPEWIRSMDGVRFIPRFQ